MTRSRSTSSNFVLKLLDSYSWIDTTTRISLYSSFPTTYQAEKGITKHATQQNPVLSKNKICENIFTASKTTEHNAVCAILNLPASKRVKFVSCKRRLTQQLLHWYSTNDWESLDSVDLLTLHNTENRLPRCAYYAKPQKHVHVC